jgi:drug/metabolite transporter (DMT)-like permease
MKSQTKGSIYILTSALFYASYGIWSRLMGHHFGEFSQAWTRGLALLIVVLLYQKKHQIFKSIKKTDRIWFIFIALAGGLNQAPYYFGFQHLPVGTAIIIFYASLLLGGYAIGSQVFKEKLGTQKILSLMLGISGMGILYRFSLSPSQIIPALIMSIAGVMGSIAAVLPKKLSSDYPEFQIMAGYFIVMTLANGIISLFIGGQLPPLTATVPWLSQLAYAASLMIANFTVIQGFKYLEASIGSLIGLAEIIFGVIIGITLFHETYGLSAIIGTLFIIISAALPNIKIKTNPTS